jgi:Rrf2 family iron-sulfur cluster assembly transcriptional regulator
MTHELWSNLNKRIQDYLRAVTLASLVDDHLASKLQNNVVHDQRIKRDKVSVAA